VGRGIKIKRMRNVNLRLCPGLHHRAIVDAEYDNLVDPCQKYMCRVMKQLDIGRTYSYGIAVFGGGAVKSSSRVLQFICKSAPKASQENLGYISGYRGILHVYWSQLACIMPNVSESNGCNVRKE
jgi:hypothetical protein